MILIYFRKELSLMKSLSLKQFIVNNILKIIKIIKITIKLCYFQKYTLVRCFRPSNILTFLPFNLMFHFGIYKNRKKELSFHANLLIVNIIFVGISQLSS